MSQVTKKDYTKERTIFNLKKGPNSSTLHPGKGVKITVDGQEVSFVETEYQGKKGQKLFINKVDDEITRKEEQLASSELSEAARTAIQKQVDYLKQQKEWGVLSFVKAFIK